MVDLRSDRTDVLELEESFGVVTRCVRRFRVLGLTQTDYTVLLNGLAAANVPVQGDKLPGANNLVVTKRTVKLVEEDPHVVDVECTYEHAFNEGQSIDSPPFGTFMGEAQVTLNQQTSNLDKDGNTIFVEHTYPSGPVAEGGDPNYPGQTKVQGGEFQYFQPQLSLKYQGIKFTSTPWLINRAIAAAINDSTWGGGDPGTWMCTGCAWKPCDFASSPSRYYMTFEFQFNPDGWDPTVVFIDDRTGKPPKNLVKDVGYKVVPKHNRVNFDTILGVTVTGG